MDPALRGDVAVGLTAAKKPELESVFVIESSLRHAVVQIALRTAVALLQPRLLFSSARV